MERFRRFATRTNDPHWRRRASEVVRAPTHLLFHRGISSSSMAVPVGLRNATQKRLSDCFKLTQLVSKTQFGPLRVASCVKVRRQEKQATYQEWTSLRIGTL